MKTEQICDGVYYRTKHEILKVCVKKQGPVLHHTKNAFQKSYSRANAVPTKAYLLHITVYICQNIIKYDCKNIINDHLWITIDTFLSAYILGANKNVH
jgi:hypothetical protein